MYFFTDVMYLFYWMYSTYVYYLYHDEPWRCMKERLIYFVQYMKHILNILKNISPDIFHVKFEDTFFL